MYLANWYKPTGRKTRKTKQNDQGILLSVIRNEEEEGAGSLGLCTVAIRST